MPESEIESSRFEQMPIIKTLVAENLKFSEEWVLCIKKHVEIQ